MLELLQAGGWLMVPILLASVLAAGISIERAWTLRAARVVPDGLPAKVAAAVEQSGEAHALCGGSAVGRILAAGAQSAKRGREAMKEAMEEAAAGVVHDLERYLTTLGTVASISPLLGLLGTVVGMIQVFRVLMEEGAHDVGLLAGGISQALITTAAGLIVAIPALAFHRYLLRKVEELVLAMEHQAGRLADLLCPVRAP